MPLPSRGAIEEAQQYEAEALFTFVLGFNM